MADKVVYESEYGILHIGEGRFFHGGTPVEVDDKAKLLEDYPYLKSASEEEPEPEVPEETEPEADPVTYSTHDESSLKKLNATEQKEVIESLGGNAEDTNNGDERIALIFK